MSNVSLSKNIHYIYFESCLMNLKSIWRCIHCNTFVSYLKPHRRELEWGIDVLSWRFNYLILLSTINFFFRVHNWMVEDARICLSNVILIDYFALSKCRHYIFDRVFWFIIVRVPFSGIHHLKRMVVSWNQHCNIYYDTASKKWVWVGFFLTFLYKVRRLHFIHTQAHLQKMNESLLLVNYSNVLV